MTFRRRIVKGDNANFYDVRSYRDRETGKVRQGVRYLGKEVEGREEGDTAPEGQVFCEEVTRFSCVHYVFHCGGTGVPVPL